jgi:hypothetical protein
VSRNEKQLAVIDSVILAKLVHSTEAELSHIDSGHVSGHNPDYPPCHNDIIAAI